MQGIKLTNKTEIGIDFNVVSNPNTHEVPLRESKYIQDGEVITSFTIKDGNIIKIGHRKNIGVNDDLEYAVENIFKYISATDLIEMVTNMQDLENKYINGLKIIRLLNFYTS